MILTGSFWCDDSGDANVLGEMRALVQLDLSHNCIYSLEGVQELSKVSTLRHLNLEQNPLCSHISYPYHVLSKVNKLETLDDRYMAFVCLLTTLHGQ